MNFALSCWTKNDYNEFIQYLASLSDSKYKAFNEKLIPGTTDTFGIPVPVLRKTATEILKGNARSFIALPKRNVHEELIIEGLVLSGMKSDYPTLLADMRYFAEKIPNWAVCDVVSFQGVKKYLSEFLSDVPSFLQSPNPWVQRFGLECLMRFYLTEEYIDTALTMTEQVTSDFYYVQMMQAWLLATALAKCEAPVKAFLLRRPVSDTVLRMTLQKMRDSRRITPELKKEMTEKLK